MTELESVTAERERAFAHLSALLRAWNEAGRKTTTAGITSALIKDHTLDLERLGFRTNQQFWDAAESAGVVRRTRLVTGHWYVNLPDWVPPAEAPPPVSESLAGPAARLRDDVWSAFVDWADDYRRFWDTETKRAFFVPRAEGWAPAHVESTRFIEIPPVTMNAQMAWMSQFADEQQPEIASKLRAALGDHGSRGAFRRELQHLALLSAWRDRLRQQIVATVGAWADFSSVPSTDLLGVPHSVRKPSGIAEVRSAPVPIGKYGTDLETLRDRVHRIVDAMTDDDLRSLPLRGEHLLGL